VDAISGQSWGMPAVPFPERPEFAALKDFHYPAYTKAMTLRAYYTPERPLCPAPETPVPYWTFSETFSYGF